MELDHSLSENIRELEEKLSSGKIARENIVDFFKSYSDVKVTQFKQSEGDTTVIYCEGMVDGTQMNEYYNNVFVFLSKERDAEQLPELPPIVTLNSFKLMIEKVFSGYFSLLFPPTRSHKTAALHTGRQSHRI